MPQVDPQYQKRYWEDAGINGYCQQMYQSAYVAEHLSRRLWSAALDIGTKLGLAPDAHVLDVGCGDGAFANNVLAHHFRTVHGIDFAEASISRARADALKVEVRFDVCDLTRADLRILGRYDGAFLIGILHHVKNASPRIIKALRQMTSRVVVLEPNGNHIVRKLLERTQAYRAAGEDSFRTAELLQMFEAAGFCKVFSRRLNVFPNFTPRAIYETFKPFEAIVESTPVLRGLCTSNVFGFSAVK